jgi:hypothetical protein
VACGAEVAEWLLNGSSVWQHKMSRRKQAAPQRKITDVPVRDHKPQDSDGEGTSSDDEVPRQKQQQQQQVDERPYPSYPIDRNLHLRNYQCPTSRFEQLHAFAELLVTTKASLTADDSEEQHHASSDPTAPHDGPVSCIDVKFTDDEGEYVRFLSNKKTHVLQLSWQVPGQPADVQHKVRALGMQRWSRNMLHVHLKSSATNLQRIHLMPMSVSVRARCFMCCSCLRVTLHHCWHAEFMLCMVCRYAVYCLGAWAQ